MKPKVKNFDEKSNKMADIVRGDGHHVQKYFNDNDVTEAADLKDLDENRRYNRWK